MEVIGHLWAELGFWFLSEKRVKMSAAADIWRARTFWQVVPVQQAVPVRQRRRPYKLGRFESRSHLSPAWRKDNTIWERALQGDWELHGGERALQPDWEGDRVEILPSPNSKSLDAYIFSRLHFRPPTSIVGRLHFSYCLSNCLILWDADMFSRAPTFHVGAYFVDLEYFV